jgi:hypothetical protein
MHANTTIQYQAKKKKGITVVRLCVIRTKEFLIQEERALVSDAAPAR